MEGVGWIATIIIGGLAGWIAERVMQSEMGLIGNIALGIAGAVVLNAILFWATGAVFGGWLGQLVVAAIGAIILIWGWRLIRGGMKPS
jgi:uncharacterized membrane protein YeaQ/YmgE (transglycosylase-associated protein family)